MLVMIGTNEPSALQRFTISMRSAIMLAFITNHRCRSNRVHIPIHIHTHDPITDKCYVGPVPARYVRHSQMCPQLDVSDKNDTKT